MQINNPIVESIGSARWCLAGSITTPAHLVQVGHSLKFIRRFDGLSSGIRFAMNAKSILPVLEINTPSSKVTLVNAKVVNIVLPVRYTTPKRSGGRLDTHELEEIELTFAKITITWKHGKKDFTDDWSTGG